MEPSRVDRIHALANMAASDAAHDFGTSFSSFFRTNREIGTPTTPEMSVDEWDTLNGFLHFKESNGTADFIKTFLNDGVRTFTRDRDDPIPYEISARLIKSGESGGDKDFKVTPSEFFEFLAPGGREVAFCIDMDSIGFTELFLVPDDGDQRIVYFVSPRESVNDGAGKSSFAKMQSITESSRYAIKVVEIVDSFAAPVVYEATGPDSDPTFYSVFNITLSPIGRIKGIPSISMRYVHDAYESGFTMIKSKSDDSYHSVNKLSEKLQALTSRFSTHKYEYYKTLQQKRSGDWFQALSCLDAGRYPDMPDIPIILCTHDRICAAYALTIGVNVLFTYTVRKDGISERWAVYMRKKTDMVELSDADRLRMRIERLDRTFPYLEARDAFIRKRDSYIPVLTRSIEEWNRRIISTNPDAAIKELLLLWGKVAYFRSKLPDMQAVGEEALDSIQRVAVYETQASILKKYKDINAIESFIEKVYSHKGDAELNLFISKISISGKLTRMFGTNMKANGTGIFTLLRNRLLNEEALNLLNALREPLNLFTGDARKNYGYFLDTAVLLLKGTGVPQIPSWILIRPILGIDDQDGGGEDESRLEISATYGPSVILATYFQEFVEGNPSPHSPITSCILLLQALGNELAAGEYLHFYLAQLLLHLLKSDNYAAIEHFMLNDILDMKAVQGADLFTFLCNFFVTMYGIEFTEFDGPRLDVRFTPADIPTSTILQAIQVEQKRLYEIMKADTPDTDVDVQMEPVTVKPVAFAIGQSKKKSELKRGPKSTRKRHHDRFTTPTRKRAFTLTA